MDNIDVAESDTEPSRDSVSTWRGRLERAVLFSGSKSEGLYPVIYGDDDHIYRIVSPDLSITERLLERFQGRHIRLFGRVDNLRGHWRLLLDTTRIEEICEITSSEVLHDQTLSG